MKTHFLKMTLLIIALTVGISNANSTIIFQGCKNLPGGDWHLILNNTHGKINFYSGLWNTFGSGDGMPGFQGTVLNCAFNQTTMQVSWFMTFKWGDVTFNRDLTGIYDPKQNRIDGTFIEKRGNSTVKGKWSATAPKGSTYNPSVTNKNEPSTPGNPPPTPSGGNSLNGTWTLYSGGIKGKPDEKVIRYTGIIVFEKNNSYLSFGSKEPLKNYLFINNKVTFERPLTGVNQKYEGTLNKTIIEGTFDHNGVKYYWKAEKK